jgi:hypothetical protein
MRTIRLLSHPLIALLCLGLAGCGGPYDSSVTGVVTLDGEPLPRGTVSFSPESGGPAAFGQIESDGQYVLRTGQAEGVRSGSYKVTVAANEPPAVARGKDGGPPPLGKPITPEWYHDPNASGLTATVKPGKNGIDFKLSKTPPAGWKPGKRR